MVADPAGAACFDISTFWMPFVCREGDRLTRPRQGPGMLFVGLGTGRGDAGTPGTPWADTNHDGD